MPASTSRSTPSRRKTKQPIAPFKSVRAPAVPLAIALACGITADRLLQTQPGWLWCGALGLMLVGPALYRFGKSRLSAACLLMLLMTTGALLHHSFWFARPQHDIDRVLTDNGSC